MVALAVPKPTLELYLQFETGVVDLSVRAGKLHCHHHIFRFDRTTWLPLIRSLGFRAADPSYPISFYSAAVASRQIRAIAFDQGWM